MDLVERYIEAIKFWLPKHLKEDVAAELREDIRSQIEEAEREKGRPLTEDEVAAILKVRGRPLTVASRYLPQRSLIGPELYPLYIFVLKIVAAICFIPPLLGTFLFNSDPALPGAFASPTYSLLVSFAIVTIIFAIIERKGVTLSHADSWNPKSLPPVANKNRIKRSESVAELIGGLVLIGFFAAGYLSQTTYHPFGLQISDAGNRFISSTVTFSPQWVPFWQFMVMVVVAEITLSAVNLFKHYWSGLRIVVRLAIDLLKLSAFVWLLQSHFLRALSAPGMSPEDAARIVGISDTAAQYAGLLGAVIAAGIVIAAVARTVHLFRGRTHALA